MNKLLLVFVLILLPLFCFSQNQKYKYKSDKKQEHICFYFSESHFFELMRHRVALTSPYLTVNGRLYTFACSSKETKRIKKYKKKWKDTQFILCDYLNNVIIKPAE